MESMSNKPAQQQPTARAEALGWQNVVVVDEDLGRSGGGVARKGFERLLLAVGAGSAGAVLSVEASRLARNGRDWHTLLDFCGFPFCGSAPRKRYC